MDKERSMVDYSDRLSEGLAVLHDLLLSEEGQRIIALTSSNNTNVRADSTRLVQELSEALESRAVIDQARGMLMTRLELQRKDDRHRSAHGRLCDTNLGRLLTELPF
jgi:hypothetical protein